MAVEIGAGSSDFAGRVCLTGDDASRFIEDVLHPSTDERRLEHLRRSDEAYERFYSSEPISDLPPRS
jgi:hypothetical protein